MTSTIAALRQWFVVRGSTHGLDQFLDRALRHLRVDDDPIDGDVPVLTCVERADGCFEVRRDDTVLASGPPSPVLARLMNEINVAAIRSVSEDHVVLHCGVAAIAGRAVLLPGRPGAGKSTLLTGLLTRGSGYLSDEAGPIDADLCVRPYPKPLVVGPGSWSSVPEAEPAQVALDGHELDAWWLDPGDCSGGVVVDSLPIAAIVAPQHRRGVGLSVTELSRAEATTTMSSNTFNLPAHGRAGIARIAALTDGIPAVRLEYSELDRACRFISGLA